MYSTLIDIIDEMKLDWLKILPLGPSNSFGGYVSENWMAVCRLIRWMYSPLKSIIRIDMDKKQSFKKDVLEWTADEMRKWLQMRGLKKQGKVHLLRARIEEYMLDPENIPTPINREECPMSMVSNTIILMNLMISRLMQKTYTSEFIDITES